MDRVVQPAFEEAFSKMQKTNQVGVPQNRSELAGEAAVPQPSGYPLHPSRGLAVPLSRFETTKRVILFRNGTAAPST